MPHRSRYVLAAVSTAVTLVVPVLPAVAHAQACFPACRSGFVCAPEGKCVSECNPPCEGGSECRAQQCVAPPRTGAQAPGRGGATRTPEEITADADRLDEDLARKFVITGGFGALVAARTAGTVSFAARYQVGEEHAFVIGPRAMIAFPGGGYDAFGVIGVDLGYRASFGHGSVRPGLLVLAQPQVYAGGGDALFHTGLAVGPIIRIGRAEIEVPLSIGRVGPMKDPFGSSRLNAVVFTASVMGGVAF